MIWRPSGDQDGLTWVNVVLFVRLSAAPVPSEFIRWMSVIGVLGDRQAIVSPLGEKTGSASVAVRSGVRLTGFEPSAFATNTSESPRRAGL